jgi:hypothetical protein
MSVLFYFIFFQRCFEEPGIQGGGAEEGKGELRTASVQTRGSGGPPQSQAKVNK